ncbi:usher protein [Stenotrophomonas maltophilia]|nr:fimbria/pilus outer membrane usher protein [Stenotrophomonas maltophilia]MDH1687276.1 fimbrial biogenesis outer membrane usher protein [Stenotrophomonas maltophilia]PJL42988.1 usher protein [Stenotrophomonas maltophilia]HEL3209023.1 fimbrial biogenesis outer membrane usher protein [Stenotrophomonas maltophilia]
MIHPGTCGCVHASSRLARAASVSLALAVPVATSAAPGIEFSEGFLIGGQSIDMRRYAQGNPVEAGLHRVDVWINGQFHQTRDITFAPVAGQASAAPCLPGDLMDALQLRAEHLLALQAMKGSTGCIDLPAALDGATATFDGSALQLQLTVPQAMQERAPRGHVPVEHRDPGITGGFVNYTANHYRSSARDSSYLGLNAGLNLGGWRVRHRASFNHGAHGSRYRTIGSHLQRDLPALNSQLRVGQGYTGGELFDSVAFTGVRLHTDERMLPDSLRGYAPTVRGIAEGNAVVSIHQNGVIIHEVGVAPGPFVIDDLYPTNVGGDLEVVVTEADGRSQRFNVAFSAVPQALREGSARFSASAGALRDAGTGIAHLRFAEGTYARGLSNHMTALGGAQVAQGYRALIAGAAANTRVGAVGVDVTHSTAELRGRPSIAGNSLRLNYQRYVARTGTNVGLAAYRYSTRGFMSLSDVARAAADDWGYAGRPRQRYQANLSQRVGVAGQLFLNGGHVAYWDSTQRQTDFQIGFNGTLGRANYGASVQRYRLGSGQVDTRYALTFSMPLGRSEGAPHVSTQISHAGGGQQVQATVAGYLGERRAVNYSLTSVRGNSGNSSGAYVDYQGRHASVNAAYSRAAGRYSQTLSASGALVVHRGGLNMGPPAGDGFALVHAPGAQGARVGTGVDIRVARNGYALLPHVSPYRWNRIDLDPSGLPLDVEMLQTSQRVAPTAGGIVRVPFEVRRERTLFIDATDAMGQPLPFAARVQREDGTPAGAVGQGGVIQLRGAQPEGVLIVDPDGPQRCRLVYQLPDAPDAYGLSWAQAMCQPLAVSPELVGAGPSIH